MWRLTDLVSIKHFEGSQSCHIVNFINVLITTQGRVQSGKQILPCMFQTERI